MTEPIKRYYIMESAVVPMLDNQVTYTPLVNHKTDAHVIPLVMAAEYDSLEQECERLRADMRFLAEYIAAESTGHPLPNYLAVGRFPVDVARAALSAKP